MNELQVALIGFAVMVIGGTGAYCRTWLMVKVSEMKLIQAQNTAKLEEIQANVRILTNGRSVHHAQEDTPDQSKEDTTQ